MMKLRVDASDLIRWSTFADQLASKIPKVLAHTLNYIGEIVVQEIANSIASQTGMPLTDILQAIDVTPANTSSLVFKIDARNAAVTERNNLSPSRPWESGRDDQTFDQLKLVNIVTFDSFCCKVCEEAEADGPYTMEQVRTMQAKWADWTPTNMHLTLDGPRTNLLHPNCRCTIAPWRSPGRKLAIRPAPKAPEELMTLKQLGKFASDQLRVEIKALKNR